MSWQWHNNWAKCCIVKIDLNMDSRVKLSILGISTSQIQSGAYALILTQVDGPYRIPIVIGASEAQSIAIKMEGVGPPRPLTHDLFVSFAHGFGVTLREVFIYKFEDGVFYAELTFSDGDRKIVLDSRTSDAIAIAIRTKAPIYTTEKILNDAGFILESKDDSFIVTDDSELPKEARLENYAIEELERKLSQLIDKEEYEEAAKVNEILKRKKENK